MNRFARILGWAATGLGLSIAIGATRVYFAATSGGTGADPSERARVLAQGISEAMNFAAFLAIGGLVAGMIVGISRSRRPPNPPAGGG